MENVIMKEIREVRKALDNELEKKPEVVKARWKEYEKRFEGHVYKGSPKLIKKEAA